jgi:hypothetical protein
MTTIRCERCNEKINPKKTIWLELSIDDGNYYLPKDFPKNHNSQGAFPFGKACSKTQLNITKIKNG